MKMNVYIDGFNLYYGAVKGTPYKWLDLQALCRRLFPRDNIHRIRYFTSKVRPTAKDPRKLQRQEIYIRALETIPNLTVHYGVFKTHVKLRVLACSHCGADYGKGLVCPHYNPPQRIEVLECQEKGSDVNLGSYLLLDGFRNEFEIAAVISNDSDLATPISLVREELKLDVGIVSPDRDRTRPCAELRTVATFSKTVFKSALESCQFPAIVYDSHGRAIARPQGW